MEHKHFTRPTTDYWQEIVGENQIEPASRVSPWQNGVPVELPDSRFLVLPIRPLNNTKNEAVASLLVNQASMEVVEELGTFLAEEVRPFEPDVVIGLPTLGLSLAAIVAKTLGKSKNSAHIAEGFY
jgi:hypothetical protein